ncbi:MAG: hypothetical protein BRD47_03820 [Bacteroidetes bacterium QS_8_68_28]|nr:MAG: hypothetical protein BRD47_03820 [Bacteroidetes bacterium QS_8_68_28]
MFGEDRLEGVKKLRPLDRDADGRVAVLRVHDRLAGHPLEDRVDELNELVEWRRRHERDDLVGRHVARLVTIGAILLCMSGRRGRDRWHQQRNDEKRAGEAAARSEHW